MWGHRKRDRLRALDEAAAYARCHGDRDENVRIVAFGKQAQLVAEHKHQGDEVFVEGSLAYSEWTDTDGNRRNALKVRADKVQFGHRRTAS